MEFLRLDWSGRPILRNGNRRYGYGLKDSYLSCYLTPVSSCYRLSESLFLSFFSQNLVEELKSELGGKFEDAIVALMSSPELNDANSFHEAMSVRPLTL